MKRPFGAAVLTSVLFVVVYNLCNRLTDLRPDVGTWAFGWERFIPLVPVMIVPYWSIDLAFVIAPFLCTTAAEIRVYRQRIVFATLAAAIGFLLVPLQLAFARPHIAGPFGVWFAALHGFDLRFNLFPSLHLAFRTVLAGLYARHTRGLPRVLVHVWFSLVGFSTLFTWQHQVVDVIGGLWLGVLAIHLFPFDDPAPQPARNATVALLYAAGAVICTQLARLAWPWTFVFVWPAFALGAAAFGYSGHGSIYRKTHGRLTLATKVLFGPLLAGQWLSWWYYRRQSAPWSELTARVWIGSVLREAEARRALAAGVTAVLDLTVEFSEPTAFGAVHYLNVPVLDLTAPTHAQLAEATAFIQRESAAGIVLIHCKAGYSRTAGSAAAWLLASGRAASAGDACRQLIAVRPRIVIRAEIHTALAQFE